MKKNLILISAALALCLSSAGCNKSGKLSQPSTFTPPAGPVELTLKWPVGERVVRNFDMKMNSEISMPNLPAPIKQDSTMGQKYGLTVLKTEAGGDREVEMEFLAMRMKVEQGGKTVIDFDSDKKAEPASKTPPIAAIQTVVQKIVGAKVQFFMDASNQVERIEGVDALMSRLGSGGTADAAAGIKSMFSDGYLKQMVGSSLLLPPNPVQSGDTWTKHIEMGMGAYGNMVMDYNLTLQSWEKHGERVCARLEFQGTIKSSPDANSPRSGMTMAIQDGSSSGVAWFDPELGLVIASDSDQDIKMIMSIPSTVRGKTITQTMTNLMHQTITEQLESVK
jgi:hypothetical protein